MYPFGVHEFPVKLCEGCVLREVPVVTWDSEEHAAAKWAQTVH